MALKLPLAEVIARYKMVHGETYDYSELVPHAQRERSVAAGGLV